MKKYEIGDEVVFLTDSYNNGVRFKITNTYFQMVDPKDHSKDLYSYRIENGISVLYKKEEDLYWIPAGTINRPKDD